VSQTRSAAWKIIARVADLRVILGAAILKAPLVSPLRLRRHFICHRGEEVGCVSAFTTSRNCCFSLAAKPGGLLVGGGRFSPGSSRVPWLSSFASASLSLSCRLSFLVQLLALLGHLGGVAGKVNCVFRFGLTPIFCLLTVVYLLWRECRR
jgi:hypothetical protein